MYPARVLGCPNTWSAPQNSSYPEETRGGSGGGEASGTLERLAETRASPLPLLRGEALDAVSRYRSSDYLMSRTTFRASATRRWGPG